MSRISSEHFIHNPEEFMAKSYEKNCVKEMFISSIFENVIGGGLNLLNCVVDKNCNSSSNTEEVGNSQEPESQKQIIKNLKGFIKDFSKLPENRQKDLIKKYSAIKATNPDITETQLQKRLNNYLKALNAHDIELQMGQEILDNGLENALNNSTLKIVDEDIANANDQSSPEFLETLLNRGAGYVELYDTNGDEKISLTEFITLEENNLGQKLTDEEIEATKTKFNRIDKDGSGDIDSIEMASHLYAISRITDGNGSNSTSDITFKEWSFAATEVGSPDDITKENQNESYTYRYNGHSDALYRALKARATN